MNRRSLWFNLNELFSIPIKEYAAIPIKESFTDWLYDRLTGKQSFLSLFWPLPAWSDPDINQPNLS